MQTIKPVCAHHLRKSGQTFGAPPPTWIVTSRSDGKSGIRLFRCDLPGPFRASFDGGDVDVIHHGHRYVGPPPSLHPEGRTYALVICSVRLPCVGQPRYLQSSGLITTVGGPSQWSQWSLGSLAPGLAAGS